MSAGAAPTRVEVVGVDLPARRASPADESVYAVPGRAGLKGPAW